VGYRVILKDDGIEIEIGSIGIRRGRRYRALGPRIDNVIPMLEIDAQGIGNGSMRQFRAAWPSPKVARAVPPSRPGKRSSQKQSELSLADLSIPSRRVRRHAGTGQARRRLLLRQRRVQAP
jgi:hypothetical protein